ncbi:MAG TPA: hypothetical protein PKI61_01110 [bacterium]|nr:hypothetical protein [bacterium]HPT29729.1 hypothetical protein [bacterium]
MINAKGYKILIFSAVLGLAVICFSFSSAYNFYNQRDNFVKWSSPDETANYFFSKLYAQTGTLSYYEPYNLPGEQIIHPRSIKSDGGLLKPVSFLGMILVYGQIAMAAGIGILPYLTPLLAALGVIFFYLLVEKWSNSRRLALIAAALLSVFPVYTYYAARSFFHNVPFIAFVIIGLYFWSLMILGERRYQDCFTNVDKTRRLLGKLLHASLAGFFIGLAIITRTAEALWLVPALFLATIIYYKKLDIFKVAVFVTFLGFAILPVLSWNKVLYGGFFQSGYNEMNQSVAKVLTISQPSGAEVTLVDRLEKIKDAVFYFGLNPKQSILMFKYYVIDMFPYLFWPAVVGGLFWLINIRKRPRSFIVFLILWLFITALLVLYYGSWKFSDNPDPNRLTIGNSYTRYWLPIYLGLIIFAAYGADRFSYLVLRRQKLFANLSCFAMALAFSALSVNFVLFGSEEGLWYSQYNFDTDRQIFNEVIALTEPEAVIITRYQDKLFFPERRVIVGLFDDVNMNQAYARLARYIPVYYFNFRFKSADVEYLNYYKFKELGLKMREVKIVTYNLALYKLERLK